VSPSYSVFLTDGRYAEQIKEELPAELESSIVKDYRGALKALAIKDISVTVSPKCPLNVYGIFTECTGTFIDENDLVGRMRMVKDMDELELIQQSFTIAGESFLECLGSFRYGDSETEWAAKLEYAMRRRGAKDRSFETIIASGARGALPHGTASEKTVNQDDPVVVDYGCKVNYCSDITRIIYGGDDSFVFEIASVVKGAMDAAKAVVRPGVRCSAVDAAARNYINEKGYGEYFNHGLGHGVGIDVHESPSFSSRDDTVLEEGMVLTVEPGIYLPKRFGIRLEDTVAVSENSCVNLTAVLEDYVYKIHQR
jgi:Xaa-Pro aminopeptidase